MAGVFKAYDIRGVVGSDLNEACAHAIGLGLAREVFASEGPIVVTRDMRTHSPALSDALIRGLSEGGCTVLDLGLAASPLNYWANVHYASGGSVTVTASHNGPKYNGFKVSGAGAVPIDYASGLDRVEAFVTKYLASKDPNAAAPVSISTGPAKVETETGALVSYLAFMDKFVTHEGRRLKVAIDTANGMGGSFLPEFCQLHPWLVPVPLYWELDGTFPHHEADPLKSENLRDLQALVVAERCDFGVAFDGDADRCMFVDETGAVISSDLVTALFAGEMLSEHPGESFLYDLRSSHIVPEWIREHGGIPVRGRVGHSFMKRAMKSQGIRFGGELSGHYYFADCFDTDSGLMAMIQMINLWQRREAKLSEIVHPLRRYSATGELNFKVSDVPDVQARLEEHYRAQGAELDHLDGLSVEMGDWWFNVRSSNTEPLLRLNLEAANEESREARCAEVCAIIKGGVQ